MTILITGSAGLLGSSLSHWLIENTEHRIIGVDDLSGGYKENMPDHINFRFVQVDCVDGYLNNVFQIYKPDYVYHMAAYAAECVSPFIRCFNYTNNLTATANVVNCCIRHKVKRLVFTSSMAVYGHGKAPFSEDAVCNPCDPYGNAKRSCEIDIQIAGEQHGLDWCIIRPHNIFGERQNLFDPYRNFIGIAMYKGLIGDPITVYGDGEQKRAFSYIGDILEPLYNAATSVKASKEIINLGGVHEYSINYVANIVSRLSGSAIIKLPPRQEVKDAYATWFKSELLLNFKHKTNIEEGIERMWAWAKTQPLKERFIWDKYEISENIYPYWEKDALKDGYYKRK